MKPPIPPIIADNMALSLKRRGADMINWNINIKGVIFCNVLSSQHIFHGRLAITEGNQKWAGLIPSFIVRAINIIVVVKMMDVLALRAINRIILDGTAWANRYFILPSFSLKDWENSIIGINE